MTAPSSPALPRLVEVEHVAKRTGVDYDTAERAQVEDYLESVTAVVLDEGDPSWTASTAPARVRVIVVDAVERRLNNPEQLAQRIMAGDLEQYGQASGGWLTDTELATVRRIAGKDAAGGNGSTVTSSRTALPAERVRAMRTGWWDDDDGGYYPRNAL